MINQVGKNPVFILQMMNLKLKKVVQSAQSLAAS